MRVRPDFVSDEDAFYSWTFPIRYSDGTTETIEDNVNYFMVTHNCVT